MLKSGNTPPNIATARGKRQGSEAGGRGTASTAAVAGVAMTDDDDLLYTNKQ
jgi:hypothetical protein